MVNGTWYQLFPPLSPLFIFCMSIIPSAIGFRVVETRSSVIVQSPMHMEIFDSGQVWINPNF